MKIRRLASLVTLAVLCAASSAWATESMNVSGKWRTVGLAHRVYDTNGPTPGDIARGYIDSLATNRVVTVTLNGLADWAAGTTGMVRDTTVGFKINSLARDNAASDTTAVLMRVAVVNAGGSSATWGATDSLFIILQGSNGSITSATSSTGTQTWKTLAVYATVWSGFNLIRDASVDILATGRSFGTIATPTLATLALGGVLIRHG